MQSHLSVFYFVACVFDITSKKSLPNTLLGRLSPMFPNSSGYFIVWGNTFIIYLFIWLSGLSCSRLDLGCIMRDLSLQHSDSLVWHVGSVITAGRLSSCGTWIQLPHGMWDLSSPTRNRTCIPCVARQILNHQITRGVPRVLHLGL